MRGGLLLSGERRSPPRAPRRRKPHTKSASRPLQQWAGRFALMRSGVVWEETLAVPALRGEDAAERLLRGKVRRRKPHTKGASRPFQQWAGRFALMRSGMVRKKTPAAPAPPSVGWTRPSGFLGERGLGKEPSFSRKKVPSPEKPHVPHITQNIAFSVAGLWLFCVSDA